MSGDEKRDHERYGLELPVKINWNDTSGTEREATGTTKNISSSGALIVCNSPIEEGCNIDVRIDFPISLAGVRKSRVKARGTVVRDAHVSNPFQVYGRGIRFDNLSFSRL